MRRIRIGNRKGNIRTERIGKQDEAREQRDQSDDGAGVRTRSWNKKK